jgi:hypothetical protein
LGVRSGPLCGGTTGLEQDAEDCCFSDRGARSPVKDLRLQPSLGSVSQSNCILLRKPPSQPTPPYWIVSKVIESSITFEPIQGRVAEMGSNISLVMPSASLLQIAVAKLSYAPPKSAFVTLSTCVFLPPMMPMMYFSGGLVLVCTRGSETAMPETEAEVVSSSRPDPSWHPAVRSGHQRWIDGSHQMIR